MRKNLLRKGRDTMSRLYATVLKSMPVLFIMAGLCHAKEGQTTTESDYTFNEGVRYSQWVIDSRINDFYANTTKVGLAVYDGKGNQTTGRVDGKNVLDYVPGLVAKGIIEAAQYYSQYTWAQQWAKPWYMSVEDYGNHFCDKYKSLGGSLDDLNAAKLYLPLRQLSATDGKYNNTATYGNTTTALDKAVTGLQNHNRDCRIASGTTAEKEGYDVTGGWWHKKVYNNQMWLDGQYMGGVLLAQLINYKGNGENVIGTDDWDIAVKQLNIIWNMCWNKAEQLMYHAFDANAGTNSNSHSETWAGLTSKEGTAKYQSSTYWARACGWYFLALVDMLEEMDKAEISRDDARYTTIKNHLDDLAAGLKRWQDSNTGGWYQILNEDGTFSASEYNNGKAHAQTYNYIESSATAIFAAGYLKAIRLGYLEESKYTETAQAAYRCMVNLFFATDNNDKDKVHIFGSCRSAGLGNSGANAVAGDEKYRNGSKEYYLLGSDVARVNKDEQITEGKVLGAFILAATEYERTYQKDKEILFEKDLRPSYGLTAGTTGITVKASGSGTPTYRWHREDGKNIDDMEGVTSATFFPTLSGKYYCVATAGGTTITSRLTEVTVTPPAISEEDKIEGATEVNTAGGENGTIYSYTVSQNENEAKEYNATGGTATLGYAKVEAAGFKSDGNIGGSKYILVKLTEPAKLQAGDVINIRAYSTKDNGGIVISAENKSSSPYIEKTLSAKNTEEILSYTVTSDILNGKSSFYLNRIADVTTYIRGIEVTRITSGESGTTTYTYRVAENYKTPALNSTRAIKDGDNTLVTMKFGGWRHNDGRYTTAEDGEIKDSWYSAKKGQKEVDGFKDYFTSNKSARNEKKGSFTEGMPYALPVRGAFMTMEPAQNGKLAVYVMHTGDFYVTNQRGTILQKAAAGPEDIAKYEFGVNAGETYYLFSNTSAISFCGATFIPGRTQPEGTAELNDTEAYTAAENAGGYATVKLTRALKAGQWNTLTLPFNMTETEVENVFGAGTQIIILDKAEVTGSAASLHFVYHEIQNILAGYPYLIKPTGKMATETIDAIEFITVSNKHIATTTPQTAVSCGSYTAKGTPGYSTADVTNAAGTPGYSIQYKTGDIFLSDGNGKLYISQGKSYGKGYRSYIEKNDDGTAAAKTITMSFAGVDDGEQGTTTAISPAELAPGTIQTAKAKGVYSLGGQKVADSLQGLPKGVYIANGHKITIKY